MSLKDLFVVAVLGVAGFKGYEHFTTPQASVYDGPAYVAVYGRDNCGLTQQMRKDLDIAGVDYQYYNVDDPRVADRLHGAMRASGISTRRYRLPVVDVSGDIHMNSTARDVREAFATSLAE